MQAILYNIDDPLNKMFKTLPGGSEIDINLKNVSNVNSFSVVLKNDKPIFNYIHFPKLGYYYISDIEVINNSLTRYYLEVDVLMTYSDLILNSHARVRRSIKNGDYMNVNIESCILKTVNKYLSDKSLADKKTLILTTVGE